MKQIGTKQFNSNDVMSLHRDMTAVKTLNETIGLQESTQGYSRWKIEWNTRQDREIWSQQLIQMVYETFQGII